MTFGPGWDRVLAKGAFWIQPRKGMRLNLPPSLFWAMVAGNDAELALPLGGGVGKCPVGLVLAEKSYSSQKA